MRGAPEAEPAPPGVVDENDALERLAAVTRALVEGSPADCIGGLVEAVASAARADVAIARTADAAARELVARAVYAESPALAAELEGSRLPTGDAGFEEVELRADDDRLPAALRRDAQRARAEVVRIYPLALDGEVVATLELLRSAGGFTPREQMLGRLAAAHLGVAVRLGRAAAGAGRGERTGTALERVADALAAGADETETAEQIVRLALEATGAAGAALWRLEADAPPSYLAGHGLDGQADELGTAAADAARLAVQEHRRFDVSSLTGDPARPGAVVTIALGEPPVGALQLLFEDRPPTEEELELLSAFTARAAVALRRSRRVGLIATALRRSQTVIGVVSQAIAQLSLAHTLETAVERIAELTASSHVGIYLREGERLTAAASRGLSGAHTELAERLLELALGPFRGRGYLFIEDMRRDRRLKGLEPILRQSGIRRALLIPLIVHDEVIGALGVFKTRPRAYREGEEGLLIALSRQLAVAVQNARLHERTKELGGVLERTLESERRAARQLRGLYEISQSFAESLSLQATLDAVARTMVELFDVDAAAIRMPDERTEQLELRALYAADPKLRDTAPALIGRPQPLAAPLARTLLRSRRPVLLRPGTASPTDTHRLLDPFLSKGSTAVVLPLATPGELLGTLTLLSLDPARPLDLEAADAAMTVAAQAALAVDNARLYQQQKDFSEMMQRSLLPRGFPDVPGLEVGHVYESAARVEVGGDVYDFLPLDDGRLAVALGDVTGKGIAAAADMAMAKFSFRALARATPEPSEFLAAVNDVVAGEVEPGKFVTMLYVLLDPSTGDVACASAGHPAARVVGPGGEVSELAARGLALGIAPGEDYATERKRVEPGSTVVLYTDGVIEARRGGELYGQERLDQVLRRRTDVGAQDLAEAVLADCRAFAGGELDDDCAIVCLKLAP